MVILGIDYGLKKIGLAKSDFQGVFALPLEIIRETNQSVILSKLKEVVEREEIDEIVVGLPIALKADETKIINDQLKTVNDFVSWLKNNFNLPIHLQDERLTSRQAKNLIAGSSQKGDDDSVAAMLILQSFLDQKKIK